MFVVKASMQIEVEVEIEKSWGGPSSQPQPRVDWLIAIDFNPQHNERVGLQEERYIQSDDTVTNQ